MVASNPRSFDNCAIMDSYLGFRPKELTRKRESRKGGPEMANLRPIQRTYTNCNCTHTTERSRAVLILGDYRVPKRSLRQPPTLQTTILHLSTLLYPLKNSTFYTTWVI